MPGDEALEFTPLCLLNRHLVLLRNKPDSLVLLGATVMPPKMPKAPKTVPVPVPPGVHVSNHPVSY